MSTSVVTPPAAAARVAVAKPSHSVRPGSLMWTWRVDESRDQHLVIGEIDPGERGGWVVVARDGHDHPVPDGHRHRAYLTIGAHDRPPRPHDQLHLRHAPQLTTFGRLGVASAGVHAC